MCKQSNHFGEQYSKFPHVSCASIFDFTGSSINININFNNPVINNYNQILPSSGQDQNPLFPGVASGANGGLFSADIK